MRVEQITYGLAGKKYDGALVYDETITRPRPALLMCPNWMGVRQQAFDRAALLAQDRSAKASGRRILARPRRSPTRCATIPPRHAGACASPTMLSSGSASSAG